MEFLDLPSIVRQDVYDALAYTKQRYGSTKASDYADLILEALEDLTRDPQSGHRRADIHPDAWVYPIKKPGRNARHLFLYEIVEGVPQIYGLVYDGRNLPSQWRTRATE
jgi:plasmid stabilization system protein ParE